MAPSLEWATFVAQAHLPPPTSTAAAEAIRTSAHTPARISDTRPANSRPKTSMDGVTPSNGLSTDPARCQKTSDAFTESRLPSALCLGDVLVGESLRDRRGQAQVCPTRGCCQVSVDDGVPHRQVTVIRDGHHRGGLLLVPPLPLEHLLDGLCARHRVAGDYGHRPGDQLPVPIGPQLVDEATGRDHHVSGPPE